MDPVNDVNSFVVDEEARKKILRLLEQTQDFEVKKERTFRELFGVADAHDEAYWVEYCVANIGRR